MNRRCFCCEKEKASLLIYAGPEAYGGTQVAVCEECQRAVFEYLCRETSAAELAVLFDRARCLLKERESREEEGPAGK